MCVYVSYKKNLIEAFKYTLKKSDKQGFSQLFLLFPNKIYNDLDFYAEIHSY